MVLDVKDIDSWVLTTFDGLAPQSSWGERSYFYNPGGRSARGTYFLTIKEKDGANDRSSNMDRPGIWRLNFGLPRLDFIRLFGTLPTRPGKGQAIHGPWDFTALDLLTPHPVYGWMGWVSILNPSPESFDGLKPLIEAAYGKARENFARRK
jgi:hypothetical protein